MKLPTFLGKITLERAQKAKDVLQLIRKNFSTTSAAWRGGRRKGTTSLKVIVPGNCRKYSPPIISPECRVAVVVGGCSSSALGLVAAEQLLRHGAKRVVLADAVSAAAGAVAAERLCKAYGKGRAKFYPCDPRNSCQVEGIFKSSQCRDEEVSILVSDLDALQQLSPHAAAASCGDAELSNARRISTIALELMSAKCKSSGGVIVNCASILGLMGWPEEPEPVYCGSEAAIQTTLRMAASHPVEQTGIRLVALCPCNSPFEAIGLPDLPASVPESSCRPRHCTPDPRQDRSRLGRALLHVMARAPSGSGWLVEPPFTVRVEPRLLFPLPPPGAEKCPPVSATSTPCSPGTRQAQCSCKTKQGASCFRN